MRDANNPMATRFELRSPNPKSNTYLVLASGYMAMLDGIRAALTERKTPKELEQALSKEAGQEAFYLEKERAYRSERDVFVEYTQEERDRMFGRAPATVWENITAFDQYPEKLAIFQRDGVMSERSLDSYRTAIVSQWATELHDRLIPNTMDLLRECRKLHADDDCTDYDVLNWGKIQELRNYLGKDRIEKKCLLTRTKAALDAGDYALASDLQLEIQRKVEELVAVYARYRKNLF